MSEPTTEGCEHTGTDLRCDVCRSYDRLQQLQDEIGRLKKANDRKAVMNGKLSKYGHDTTGKLTVATDALKEIISNHGFSTQISKKALQQIERN